MPFHNLLLTSRNDILRFEWFSIPAAVCTSGRDADGMENRIEKDDAKVEED